MELGIGNNTKLEHGCRCRIKKSTIFGTFCGYVSPDQKKSIFYDEELNKVKIYNTSRLERTYEKF